MSSPVDTVRAPHTLRGDCKGLKNTSRPSLVVAGKRLSYFTNKNNRLSPSNLKVPQNISSGSTMDVNDNDPGRSYNVHGTMLVIAIVSLSFVVILVILIYIYVRCVLRRQARHRTALGLLGLTHEPPMTGLDPTIVGSLPTFIFKQDLKARTIECAVCLSDLEDGEMIRFLPNCEHNFHVACIDTWLITNTTCPVCRTAAEPMKVVLESVGATPETARPLDVESTDRTAKDLGKVLGSSSRLSSFRKMLSRDHSSQRTQV